MQIKVLGTSSGIGQHGKTTSFLLDSSVLLDCGSGVGDLSLDDLRGVDTILLTHSHLSHTGFLPFLADIHANYASPGLTIYSQADTLTALQTHLFNNVLWPDYLPHEHGQRPLLTWQPIEVGDTIKLTQGLATALPAAHNIPGLGWLIEGAWRSIAFSGDTGPCLPFWHWIAGVPSLTDVICELSYPNSQSDLAAQTGHLSPALLVPLLELLPPNVHLWISQMDEQNRQQLMAELTHDAPSSLHIHPLKEGTLIEL